MAYLVEIAPAAKKALDGLPADPQVPLVGKIQKLGGNPRPASAKRLPGGKGARWCLPHKAWRVLYAVDDAAKRVLVRTVEKGSCG